MRHTLLTSVLAVAVTTAVAHDVTASFLEDGATSMCGKWDYVVTGAYTLYQDLWNEGAGTGTQCTTINSPIVDSDSATDEGGSSSGSGSEDVLAWSTSWSWAGDPTQVKSYANAVTNFTVVHLADIDAIPTAWSWTYAITSSTNNNELFANVAYDTFTTSSPSAVAAGQDADFEVMVWVATFGGAGPLTASGHAIKTGLTLAGATWDLWMGYNGATRVYSFVATATAAATLVGEGRWEGEFSGDLLVFFDYLVDHEGLPLTQYLLSVHAGTESFAGEDAVFSVPSYSCGVSTAGSAAATGTAVVGASSVAAVANDAATATAKTTTTSHTAVEGRATASPSSSSSSSTSRSSFSVAVAVASSSSSSRATTSPRHLSSSSSTTTAVTVPVPVPSASPPAQTPASSIRPQTGPSPGPGSSSAQVIDSSSTSRAAGVSVGAASSQPGGYNFTSIATPAAGVRLTAAPAVPVVWAAMTVGTSPTTLATSTVVKKDCRVRRAERGEGGK